MSDLDDLCGKRPDRIVGGKAIYNPTSSENALSAWGSLWEAQVKILKLQAQIDALVADYDAFCECNEDVQNIDGEMCIECGRPLSDF